MANPGRYAKGIAKREEILTRALEVVGRAGPRTAYLADIADAVGLARSSLYRYFPGKDQILQAWFAREMGPVIADSRAILARPEPVEARLTAWLGLQLDYLREADHELAPRLAQELGAVSPEVQQAIADQHAELYGSLDTLVTEALAASGSRPARDHDVVLALLVGLVRAATQAIAGGADPARVGPELNRAALALLDA